MLAPYLNQNCHCISLDAGRLAQSLPEGQDLASLNPLFAAAPVFVEASEVQEIETYLRAVLEVTRLPAFVEHALEHAPAIARVDPGTPGTLHGLDFHLTESGPRLIEINTNAGGALLNAKLAGAQAPCCEAVSPLLAFADASDVQDAIIAGFESEFALARGAGSTLRSVVIVDENPPTQFLYREFELFRSLFESRGIRARIADPCELRHEQGALWLEAERVDLVYNRLTDFYLTSERSQALANAYRAGDVVLTPHPRAHALLANKRHLASFCDAAQLTQWGASATTVATLTRLTPHAEVVHPDNRERLYQQRKQLFFKPLVGYGSKATYRGDKLTRGKFSEILEGEYLAQDIVLPSERHIPTPEGIKALKLDVRAYVVADRCVLMAARLYQGQTTNFRTPGGGFAAVLALPAPERQT